MLNECKVKSKRYFENKNLYNIFFTYRLLARSDFMLIYCFQCYNCSLCMIYVLNLTTRCAFNFSNETPTFLHLKPITQ